MAARRVLPNPDGQRRRRNAPTFTALEVVDEPYGGRVPLKPDPSWPAATQRWWQVVSRMPHCVLWADSDWSFVADTAIVHAAFVNGDVRLAGEVRLREATLGVTLDARRHLRLRYVSADEVAPEAAEVASLNHYRQLLDG